VVQAYADSIGPAKQDTDSITRDRFLSVFDFSAVNLTVDDLEKLKVSRAVLQKESWYGFAIQQ
jgi:hypothetical protein